MQREIDHQAAGETFFDTYDIFNRRFPSLPTPLLDGDEVIMRKQNRNQRIRVGCIYMITAVSDAASILIGNGMKATAESRIMNIRRFADPIPPNSLSTRKISNRPARLMDSPNI